LLSQTISHYRIVNRIGTSLIGEVYLAEDTHLGRTVALTLLPEWYDAERMQRVTRECRAISALNHPNIRTIYDVGQHKSQYFIVTEYVDGPTMRDYLSHTRLQIEEVIGAALQILAGLAAAHSAGVLHRDMRPDNIVLRRDGFVKILDFGLAKLVEQDALMVALGEARQITEDLNDEKIKTEREGTPDDEDSSDPYKTQPLGIPVTFKLNLAALEKVGAGATGLWWSPGTIGYLSPEQIRDEPIDERSDIFSFGVVLYEMCAGRLPFEGSKAGDVLSSILEEEPAPIRHFMREAPRELELIIARALEKRREERYQTAREMLNDLKHLKQRMEFESGRQRYSNPDRQRINQSRASTAGRSEAVDSIAVLPLSNSGNDRDVEYLCDGITESIINTLSRLPGLRVMARSTVFRYKGRDVYPQDVGRELGVRAVFIGRLLQRGENIVIKTELVDAIDGSLLLAEQYQSKSGDLFELEADIAKQISDHLRIKITGEQQRKLAQHDTDDPQAYDLYLKGRFFWNQRNPEAMKKGIEYFVQAIKKDATYAKAYSGLADCYTLLSWYSVPPREFVPKARMSVTKALKIDDQLPEAHTSLGFIALWYDWDFFEAEQEFLWAIELNPNYPTARHWYSYCLFALERYDEALENIRNALELDPLSLIIITDIGEQFYRQRRYEEALAQFQRSLEMDSEFGMARYWMLRTWLEVGQVPETIAALEDSRTEESQYGNIALLAIAYARAGRSEEAQRILSELQEVSDTRYVQPYHLAMIAANLDEIEQAFLWLDKAYQERSGWLPWLKQDPLADSLRGDTRFSDLLERVGLKP
jgi:serine/threonine protein kinase/tetratricopeptide (TPR) repeat protein